MKNRTWKIDPLVLVLMVIGIVVRLVLLGKVPGGINQDEAFAGYEAYSLLHYGIDSSGYAFPVYFVSWGSGMNVLNSYLMIPFIALFGVHTWVIRLPQAIVGCLSLYVFYRLMRLIMDEKVAKVSLFYLAICPWHIMLSRWGLESNLAPAFLLFGLYFFVLGVKKPKYLLASAVCYGLSLYSYATIWIIVPFILLLQILYLWYTGQLKLTAYHALAAIIMGLMALPLVLFLLINAGYMEEVRTAVFSIPKLCYARTGEISFSHIPRNLINTLSIIIKQNDGFYWNSTEEWGLYYKFFGATFAVLGLLYVVVKVKESIQKREYRPEVFLFIQFVMALVLGCLIYVNANRVNCIHLWVVAFTGIGLYEVVKKCKESIPHIKGVLIGILSVCFILFTIFYFTEYREKIGEIFQDGVEEAVAYAMEASEGEEVHIAEIYYPKVLLFSKMPADEYVATVQYINYPSAYLDISSAGRIRFNEEPNGEDGVFITSSYTASNMEAYGYDITYFNQVAVLKK